LWELYEFENKEPMTRGQQSGGQSEFTTLCIRKSTKDRLESIKPFESLSWDEFIENMADSYDGEA